MLRTLFFALIAAALVGPSGAFAQATPSKAQIENATMLYLNARNEDARANLVDALAAYSGPPTVQSINGHLTLMAQDAASEDAQRRFETAQAATTHLQLVAEIMPKQYLEARFRAAVARFEATRDTSAAYELAHVQGISGEIENQGVWPQWARTRHYQAKAWALAMLAAARADSEASISQAAYDDILARYAPVKGPAPDYGARPLCKGEVRNRARLNSPKIAGQRGQWGALVLEYDFDDDGRVINEAVLAAVPEGAFEKDALKWVKKGRFRAENRDQVGVTCRINRRGIVQDLVFQID